MARASFCFFFSFVLSGCLFFRFFFLLFFPSKLWTIHKFRNGDSPIFLHPSVSFLIVCMRCCVSLVLSFSNVFLRRLFCACVCALFYLLLSRPLSLFRNRYGICDWSLMENKTFPLAVLLPLLKTCENS